MNVMALQDLILTFENCSKCYDCFNPLSINQIKKKAILTILEIKSFKIVRKHSPFVFLNIQTQSATFKKLFP